MIEAQRRRDNLPVWDGASRGHYEVWYLKLNLPAEGLALWLRYTLTAPKPGCGLPYGELWGIVFDERAPAQSAAYRERFDPPTMDSSATRLHLRIGDASLTDEGCRGQLGDVDRGLSWSLRFEPLGAPLRLFPHAALYRTPFPSTKFVEPLLSMAVSGELTWDGRRVVFEGARGHQAHLWGTRHAQRWAWANCNDFEGEPAAVFEALSAQVRLGPVTSPGLTLAVLRVGEDEHRFNAARRWLTHRSRYDVHGWELDARQGGWRLRARVRSRVETMVGVTYRDPDGSLRVCHNSKLADLSVELQRRRWGRWRTERTLRSVGRAAYELVQPEADPHVPVLLP